MRNNMLRQLQERAEADAASAREEQTGQAHTDPAPSDASQAEGEIAGADAPSQDDQSDGDLRAELQTLKDEMRQNRRAHHQQGQIDNSIVEKAQRYDALMADPQKRSAMEGSKKAEVPDDIREILDKAEPSYRDAIKHLTHEALDEHPELKAALKELNTVKAKLESQERAKAQDEFQAFQKAVPDWEKHLDDPSQRKLQAIMQSGEFGLMEAYEMVTGQKVESSKKRTHQKPPPEVKQQAERMTQAVKQKSRDLHEAYALAEQNGFKIGEDED